MAQKPQISSLMEKGMKATVSAKDYGSHFTSKREVSEYYMAYTTILHLCRSTTSAAMHVVST